MWGVESGAHCHWSPGGRLGQDQDPRQAAAAGGGGTKAKIIVLSAAAPSSNILHPKKIAGGRFCGARPHRAGDGDTWTPPHVTLIYISTEILSLYLWILH